MRRVSKRALSGSRVVKARRCYSLRSTVSTASTLSNNNQRREKSGTKLDIINVNTIHQYRRYSSSYGDQHGSTDIQVKQQSSQQSKTVQKPTVLSKISARLAPLGRKLSQYSAVKVPVDCYNLLRAEIKSARRAEAKKLRGEPVTRQEIRSRQNLLSDLAKTTAITGMFCIPGSLLFGPAVILLFPGLIPRALSSYFYSSSIGTKIANRQKAATQDSLKKIKAYLSRFSKNKLSPGAGLADEIRPMIQDRIANHYNLYNDTQLRKLLYKVHGVNLAFYIPNFISNWNLSRRLKRIKKDDELIGSYENLKDADEKEIEEALKLRNLTSRDQLKTWLELANDKHHPVDTLGLALIPAAHSN